MGNAVQLLEDYMRDTHPLQDATLFRIDRLKQGWLAVFDCKPGGKEPAWVPQFRVVYLHEPTTRVVFDLVVA